LLCLIVSMSRHAMKCHKPDHMEIVLEQLLLTATFCFLPPLVSFTIYFNASYTPRLLLHASQLSAVRASLSQFGRQRGSVAWSTVYLIMIAVVSCALLISIRADAAIADDHASKGSHSALLKLTFILLSAASTPNMFFMGMRLSKSSVSQECNKGNSLRDSVAMAV